MREREIELLLLFRLGWRLAIAGIISFGDMGQLNLNWAIVMSSIDTIKGETKESKDLNCGESPSSCLTLKSYYTAFVYIE